MKNPESETHFENKSNMTTNPLDGIPVRHLNPVLDQISLYRKLIIVTLMAKIILLTMSFIYL